MAARGVTAVELGIPFSDPTADGPVIQAASRRALERGASLNDALDLAAKIRARSPVPLLLMGYLNPFLSLPPAGLHRRLAAAGIDGLIVPDLPPEEAGRLFPAEGSAEVDRIFLTAPTTPPRRIATIARAASGFIYCVARTGVTGTSGRLSAALGAQIALIRRHSRLPVCIGFGISTRRQLEEAWRLADGGIVGSALIRPFLEERSPGRGLDRSLKILEKLLSPE